MPTPKKELKRIQHLVQNILRNDWDPIGVNHEPLAKAEYDSYAPQILRMLLEGAVQRHFSDHLHQLATVAMGLQGNKAHDKSVAAKLLLLIP
jgi:hypothetical protein